jgi:hypothetical protein
LERVPEGRRKAKRGSSSGGLLSHRHDHFFSKEELDGIMYLEVPKPDDNTNATDYRQDGGWVSHE